MGFFQESITLELNGNVIHRPLALEDPKWNGSAYVITEDDVHLPIFGENGKEQNFVAMKISSNTEPTIHNISLVGIPHGEGPSKKEMMILPNIKYHELQDKPGTIVVFRPSKELYNLSEKYDLFLDVHNPVGKSRLPVKLMPKRLIKDQVSILWILLPSALAVVIIALLVLVFKAYSNKWWCFQSNNRCKLEENYTQGLITTEDDSHTNDNTIQSVKIYRTPIPPPPSFESNTSRHSNRKDSESSEDDNNMYEKIKDKKIKTPSSINDGYINMKPQFFQPDAPMTPPK